MAAGSQDGRLEIDRKVFDEKSQVQIGQIQPIIEQADVKQYFLSELQCRSISRSFERCLEIAHSLAPLSQPSRGAVCFTPLVALPIFHTFCGSQLRETSLTLANYWLSLE